MDFRLKNIFYCVLAGVLLAGCAKKVTPISELALYPKLYDGKHLTIEGEVKDRAAIGLI
jgi:hypothetical protein